MNRRTQVFGGSPANLEGTSGALVRDGRAQGMSSPQRPEPKRCSSAFCGNLPGGCSLMLGSEASLITRSHSIREHPNRLHIPCPYFPTEDTYERRIMVDKEEVTLVVYDIWEQVRTKMWLQAGDEPGRAGEGQSLAGGWWHCSPGCSRYWNLTFPRDHFRDQRSIPLCTGGN